MWKENKSFVEIESNKRSHWNENGFQVERVCSFSVQVVITKANQTRGYCSRRFKVDRSENTHNKKKCVERFVHHENFIVKNADMGVHGKYPWVLADMGVHEWVLKHGPRSRRRPDTRERPKSRLSEEGCQQSRGNNILQWLSSPT